MLYCLKRDFHYLLLQGFCLIFCGLLFSSCQSDAEFKGLFSSDGSSGLSITLTSSLSSITADGSSTTTLTATIFNSAGEVVSGEDLTLHIPVQGGSVALPTLPSNMAGQAS